MADSNQRCAKIIKFINITFVKTFFTYGDKEQDIPVLYPAPVLFVCVAVQLA